MGGHIGNQQKPHFQDFPTEGGGNSALCCRLFNLLGRNLLSPFFKMDLNPIRSIRFNRLCCFFFIFPNLKIIIETKLAGYYTSNLFMVWG